MSNFSDIRKALEKTLAAIVGVPAISYENVQFDPSGKDSWLRTKIQVAAQRPAAVGVGVATKHEGLFLIDCFVRADTGASGAAAADTLAEQIQAAFTYGMVIEENGKRIVIRFAERTGAMNDAPWYFVPITVEWYCYI